ncbi:MAG: hypothetical protein LKE61_03995 [Erysipelotrichaceae bacterium]|jgi:hypothetical protein|nr:hypothetical protein [Erysipelotrichaceae bacterium]MCH4044987.1 hypothetical protein [Erysipelotrichaceae bacterium]MCH4122199.1 hypothetical protein [Erysipelotrichaceae bacterium]MCI1462261.1 hypothetical protein [Solobacterium sp.]
MIPLTKWYFLYNVFMQKYPVGNLVYIIQSKRYIREAKVLHYSSGFYTIRFTDSSGGTKLRESRIYGSKDDAQKVVDAADQAAANIKYRDWIGK